MNTLKRAIDIEDVRWIINRQYHHLDRDYLEPLIKELSYLLERSEIWDLYLKFLNEDKKTNDRFFDAL
jgi:hypothetical protein